jgi:tetratricopeptide (TPR) repeat protein
MKHLFILILSVCTLTASDFFQAGVDAYHESEYEKAVEAFKKASAAQETGAAHHNLALALLQQNRAGEAVWQMERALQLEPTNEQYHYKLGAIRQQLGLNMSRPKWYELAARAISTQAWIILLAVCFWAALAAILLPRCAGLKARLPIKAIRAVSLIGLILASLALYLNRDQHSRGIILTDTPADLHAAPASAAPKTGLARPGERGQALGQFESFVEIQTEGGARGWVRSEKFRLVR